MALFSSRNSSRSRSSLPYLVFLLIAAFFVFKVDILISQSFSSARRNLEKTPNRIVMNPKKSPEEHVVDSLPVVLVNGTFDQHIMISWGDDRGKILENGEFLTLSLDKLSGSGFQSKKEYLFAKVDMQIKLVPGNSAGTVTTFYLSSQGNKHDEIDFEFLGNSTGNPYTLHTNVFSLGKGNREQQFFLWFDPTADYHTYSILWNSKCIILASNNFNQDFDVTWGDGRAKVLNNGKLLTLSLDKVSGSGVKSKKEYLFGRIDMQLKLVRGNSAGTVTTYYLSSQGSTHDEIDFEFLGNLSGDPYIVHTNVYTQGKGDKEQQFYLWFDPTADFHTYSILWNPQTIIFYVDSTPIRVFKNMKSSGVPYPNNQPMRVYASLWNADDWATRGGLIKTNWSNAPFIASFRNFKDNNACIWEFGKSSCTNSTKSWFSQELDSTSQARLQWVQKNYMVYNYCNDINRFPQGLPLECTFNSTTS
ncbi:hypothetical protein MTR67_029908 [Solanum verrucosum]|uniref:xyloglucan:xyloglucosyl transferase n=1 Tax=Solanum verrucosum TaxID=315347 RepID=A0AAF0R8B9_SOLVR|nr:hypothetical protein MTR67_029908 [Solanum verrucosum]